MAATQALREILADGVEPQSILRIGVAVLPPHLKMIDHGVTAGDRFSHLTSVQYQMAVAALAPDLAYGLSGPSGPISPANCRLSCRASRCGPRRDCSPPAIRKPGRRMSRSRRQSGASAP